MSAIHKESMFKDPTVWTMIIVSVVTYMLSAIPYYNNGTKQPKRPQRPWFMLIWAMLFVLYTIASILSYRAITKESLKEDCNLKTIQDVSKISLLMFILTMIGLLTYPYAHQVLKRHSLMTAVSFFICGFVATQMILSWKFANDEKWPPFLILPFFVWILVFGVIWSGTHVISGEEIVKQPGTKS